MFEMLACIPKQPEKLYKAIFTNSLANSSIILKKLDHHRGPTNDSHGNEMKRIQMLQRETQLERELSAPLWWELCSNRRGAQWHCRPLLLLIISSCDENQ